MTDSNWITFLVLTITLVSCHGFRILSIQSTKISPSSSAHFGFGECQQTHARSSLTSLRMSTYFDDLSLNKSEKKCLVGFTTDAWNIGQKKVSFRACWRQLFLKFPFLILISFHFRIFTTLITKYKDFLAVYKMYKRVQKANIAAVEIPMWEVSQVPHLPIYIPPKTCLQ